MSSPTERNRQKREILEKFLTEDYAFLHINTETQGVVLPLNFLQQGHLQQKLVTLKVSYNFEGAMTVSEDGVVAELSFGPKRFPCKIPWTAIWAMTSLSDERLMWPDELPQEIAQQLATEAAAKTSAPMPGGTGPALAGRSTATLDEKSAKDLSSDSTQEATQERTAAQTEPPLRNTTTPQPARPQLRRVK